MDVTRRVCAKVLLIDPTDRVLLFSGIDRHLPEEPPVWFPVGGGVDPGETLEEAAIRETAEETGFHLARPGAPVLTRRFEWVFEGVRYDQEETYFVVRVPTITPVQDGWTEVEKATVQGHRWWTVAELRATTEVVFPENLADILAGFLESDSG